MSLQCTPYSCVVTTEIISDTHDGFTENFIFSPQPFAILQFCTCGFVVILALCFHRTRA